MPPTTDRAPVQTAIDSLELDERTAIGEAIFAALDAIKLAPPEGDDENEEVPARIVLMSDGETTVGRPDAVGAAAAAKRPEVPVQHDRLRHRPRRDHTLPDEPAPVPVAVNREALRGIADATGGKAFAAATEGELREVYHDIGSSVGFVIEFREIGLWFVGVGARCCCSSAPLCPCSGSAACR